MSRFLPLPILGVLSLGACGGVSHQAQVATAIQTIMADAITSYASHESGSTSVSFACGKTSADGTISYSLPDIPSITDPSRLSEYIQDNPDGIPISNVTFNACAVKACGETLTLNGQAGLVLNIRVEDIISSGGSVPSLPAKFTLSSQSLTGSGLLSGALTFSYVIEANYTTDSLSSIEIKDTSPAASLVDRGTTYDADTIIYQSDGC
ncbi:MAG: hypothetical protein JST16_10390 [Bdellovibrionales bacterium]|nr:hypothetical protein [Bdellovibrionales bacterium]